MLCSVIETQLEWTAYVKKKTKDKYTEVHRSLDEGTINLKKVYSDYVKSIHLNDPNDKFYKGFIEGLMKLAEISCNFYFISKVSFIECVEWELKISRDALNKIWKPLSAVC